MSPLLATRAGISRMNHKTKFALGVLTESPKTWRVPLYIKEGLRWLDSEIRLELPASLLEAAEPAAAGAVVPFEPKEAAE